MPRSRAFRGILRSVGLALSALALTASSTPGLLVHSQEQEEWVVIEYGPVVDGRVISHSGDTVSSLLVQLGGRPRPGAGPGDVEAAGIHLLLDPLLEPYAFVLPDALDALGRGGEGPWTEIGWLWAPGEPQPAFAELLRARRYVVESDGRGSVRIFAPLAGGASPQAAPSGDAAERTWRREWSVLRHVLASIAAGLAEPGGGDRELDVALYPYASSPERTSFVLGTVPYRTRVGSFGPDGTRAPLELDAWRAFVEAGLQVEGGRLDADGRITLIGSRPSRPPTLLGKPLSLADFAAAYRAVFHAPGDEPYMSLDRGRSPHRSLVNYGGRLRDTALGMVSLLCDIRFKTFSVGRDMSTGEDVRERLRTSIASFATHVEHLARDPRAEGVSAQQTRLWFYPDAVDLTLSPAGDVMALRRARMTAASERVDSAEPAAADPPWTRATIDAINASYDRLGESFPEMNDLDQVVRLLSLFSWLKQAEGEGLAIPDLDALLTIELPSVPTPRDFPQLLSFAALSPAGGRGVVDVIDRSDVVLALDRLLPAGSARLSAERRFRRGMAALDESYPEHARLLAEMRAVNVAGASDDDLDAYAYAAERVRMHRLVLGTLPREERLRLGSRQSGEGRLRVFSLGIGGLDLSMRRALDGAGRRSGRLAWGGAGVASVAAAAASQASARPVSGESARARDAWKKDAAGMTVIAAPAHGLGPADGRATVRLPGGRMERAAGLESPASVGELGEGDGALRWNEVVYGAAGAERAARRVLRPAGNGSTAFERLEAGRVLRYSFDARNPRQLAARHDRADPLGARRAAVDGAPRAVGRADARGGDEAHGVAGLVTVELLGGGADGALNARLGDAKTLRDAAVPRELLVRTALGPSVVRDGDSRVEGFSSLLVGATPGHEMLLVSDRGARGGWSTEPEARPGEEEPARLAAGLDAWLAGSGAGAGPRSAVVGVDPQRSPGRWSRAAGAPGAPGALILAPGALPAWLSPWEARFRTAWSVGAVVETPPIEAPRVVVLVSGEAPAVLARRLETLVAGGALEDSLLAVVTLGDPLPAGVPARLLETGRVAGIGVHDAGLVDLAGLERALARWSRALAEPESAGRIETRLRPLLWHY